MTQVLNPSNDKDALVIFLIVWQSLVAAEKAMLVKNRIHNYGVYKFITFLCQNTLFSESHKYLILRI